MELVRNLESSAKGYCTARSHKIDETEMIGDECDGMFTLVVLVVHKINKSMRLTVT